MRHRVVSLAATLLALSCASFLATDALGVPNASPGTLFRATADGDQKMPRVAPDGSGGAYVAWLQSTGPNTLVHAQHITHDGNVAVGWLPGGVVFSADRGIADHLVLAADAGGGAFVAWDRGDMYGSVGLAHLSSAGVTPSLMVALPGDGEGAARPGAATPLSPQKFESGNSSPMLAPDGEGGVIVAWWYSSSLNGDKVYVQRFRDTGVLEPVWAAARELRASYGSRLPSIAADGAGGAFVAWTDGYPYPTPTLSMQHLTPSGDIAPGWGTTALRVCSDPGGQRASGLVADGAGGALLAWADARDPSHEQIFAQQATSAAALTRGPDGMSVCTQTVEFGPDPSGHYGTAIWRRGSIVPDGAGGALILWVDRRSGSADVFAQRLGSDGTTPAGWALDGAPVATDGGDQTLPAATAVGGGDVIVAWHDAHPASGPMLRWRRLGADGPAPSPDPTGALVSATPDSAWEPALCTDGEGGAFVAWIDRGDGFPNVHVTRVLGDHVVPGQITATTLSSNAEPLIATRTLTLTATVQPSSATGTVEFYEFGQSFGTAPLVGGVATITRVMSVPGTRTLWAAYTGDATHATSNGFIVEHVVPRTPTAMDLASSANPTLVGWHLALTATLPAASSGSVEFFDSGISLGAAPLVAGVATLPYDASPSPGIRWLQAVYAGDTTYAGSTDSLALQAYLRFPVTVTIASAANPCPSLDVALTAHVAPVPASGSIVFADDTGPLGAWPLDHGAATLPYHAARYSPRTVTATYAGDPEHEPGATVYLQQFQGQTATMALASSVAHPAVTQAFTLTSTLTPAAATGTVSFSTPTGALGTAPLIAGVATLPCQFTQVWSGMVTAVYSGDATYTQCVNLMPLDIQGIATQTALASSSGAVIAGSLVRFTATVAPPTATGNVLFYVDDALQATVALASGRATFTSSALAPGTHHVVASYPGAGAHLQSASTALTQNVFPVLEPFLRVLAPNDGEQWSVGFPAEIRWDATTAPDAPLVSIYLARSNPPMWEPIAENVPNTGAFTWTVTGPGTGTGDPTARVMVMDPEGIVNGDASDLPFSIAGGTVSVEPGPSAFALGAAWPNPSRGRTTLRYAVASPARVRLSVLDLMGREIAVLARGDHAPGRYEVEWNGRTDRGTAPVGLYFVRFTTPAETFVERLTIVR